MSRRLLMPLLIAALSILIVAVVVAQRPGSPSDDPRLADVQPRRDWQPVLAAG